MGSRIRTPLNPGTTNPGEGPRGDDAAVPEAGFFSFVIFVKIDKNRMIWMLVEMMTKKTVLIVDDSKFARFSLSAIVTRNFPGWIVMEAADGVSALALHSRSPADFVLLDFNMPGEDGLLVAQKIVALHPETRIALVTANVQDPIARQAALLGLGFIPKPVEPALLLAFLTGAP